MLGVIEKLLTYSKAMKKNPKTLNDTVHLCQTCLYYLNSKEACCLAYPDGIPKKFWEQDIYSKPKHTKPQPDQWLEYTYKFNGMELE